tara:strand:+ start:126 stop:614 length:489 start_codon:yes stop_codon:yes gene_type:complete
MKFKIEIDCDNAAFQGVNFGAELIQTMRRFTALLPLSTEEARGFELTLTDSNGNTVGRAQVEEDPEVQAPRSVEFIICRDDNTWDTQVMEVPHGQDPVEWMSSDCGGSHVAFIGVFNEDPEVFTQENEYILCAKCQSTEHMGDALYLGDDPICIKCYREMLT